MKRFWAAIFVLVGTLAVAAPGPRIVSAGGTVTEILYALGLGPQVVGVDTSSLYPAEALKNSPAIGYVRQLSAEGVLSLAPQILVTTVDAGPPAVLTQIRGAGVKVLAVPGGASWQAAAERIRFVAQEFGAAEAGQRLIAQLEEAHQRVDAKVQAKKTKPARVLFIYSRGAGMLMVSGRGTEADAVIGLAGGVNAVTAYEGYRPLTPEALAAAQPDLLLFTSLGLQSLGGKGALAALPAFADRVTLERAQVAAVDDLLLLGFGPRLGEAVETLEALLPPGR